MPHNDMSVQENPQQKVVSITILRYNCNIVIIDMKGLKHETSGDALTITSGKANISRN